MIAEEFLMYRAARVQARGTITAADYVFRHHGAVRTVDLANQVLRGYDNSSANFIEE
jgi:hypothetical protein